MSQGQSAQTFILKPTNGSQGSGIHLVQTCGQLQELGKQVDIGNLVAQVRMGHPKGRRTGAGGGINGGQE